MKYSQIMCVASLGMFALAMACPATAAQTDAVQQQHLRVVFQRNLGPETHTATGDPKPGPTGKPKPPPVLPSANTEDTTDCGEPGAPDPKPPPQPKPKPPPVLQGGPFANTEDTTYCGEPGAPDPKPHPQPKPKPPPVLQGGPFANTEDTTDCDEPGAPDPKPPPKAKPKQAPSLKGPPGACSQCNGCGGGGGLGTGGQTPLPTMAPTCPCEANLTPSSRPLLSSVWAGWAVTHAPLSAVPKATSPEAESL